MWIQYRFKSYDLMLSESEREHIISGTVNPKNIVRYFILSKTNAKHSRIKITEVVISGLMLQETRHVQRRITDFLSGPSASSSS